MEILYALAIGSVRTSSLLLYSRIFPGRPFRITLWSVGVFVAACTGVQVLTAVFQCRPIQAACVIEISATCVDINLFFMIMAGLNVLTDLILLVAPLPTIWSLQMHRATKVQLMGLFCVGSLYVATPLALFS